MNIALIAGNFLHKKGGISTTLKNFYIKLTNLGENIYIFNNSTTNQSSFKIITNSKETFKDIFHQKMSFYIFLIFLLFRILFFNSIKFKDKIKLAFYYCFYPFDIVNRIKSIKNYISYFKKHEIDVIFCISSSYPLFYGFILSKMFKKPLITLAHGEDFIRRYPNNINNTIFHNIEKIVVSNTIMKRLFLKIHKINKKRIEIIFRAVNIEKVYIKETKFELRNSLNINLDDFIILTVSRIHPRKGIRTVISALNSIIDENPKFPIKYYIIGDGKETEKLKNIVLNLKLENYVKFLGSVNDIIRNKYYKLSDLFILIPEIKKDSIEGFGIVYIEANYFKLPVIGSSSGGIKSAIIDNKTGFIIEPKDVINLKEKILYLYNNKKFRDEIGEYGYNRVKELFNWNKNAIIYRNILKKTVIEYFNN